MAVLGHDLRNPLAAIAAGTSVLLRRIEDDNAVAVLRQIRSSVGRMSELIDNLMDLTRVRLGDGLGIERHPVANLRAGLERVIEEIRLASPEARIEARLDIGGEGACDGPRIYQIVSNLLANAVSYGDGAEPIQVEAVLREGRLVLSVANAGDPILSGGDGKAVPSLRREPPEQAGAGPGPLHRLGNRQGPRRPAHGDLASAGDALHARHPLPRRLKAARPAPDALLPRRKRFPSSLVGEGGPEGVG